MLRLWRVLVGVLLVVAAWIAVDVMCAWGTELDRPAVLLVPGWSPPTGLYAAPGIPGNGFLSICGGVLLPMLLLTAAVWVLMRVWADTGPDDA